MPANQTRAEHLQWAKDRALAFLGPTSDTFIGQISQRIRHAVVPLAEAEQVIDAWNSFVSDLGKHPQTTAHTAIMLGTMQMMGGHLRTIGEMRDFIEGIN